MAYFIAVISLWFAFAALTALHPAHRGLFQFLAYPLGWAAGEFAGQALVIQALLLDIQLWWGWPRSTWLGVVLIALAVVVAVSDSVLIVAQMWPRRVVRRALAEAPVRPLDVPRSRDDQFGSWWRTLMQVPWHPRYLQITRNVRYGPLLRHRLDLWRLSRTPQHAPVVLYVHGGAWTFGNKQQQSRPMLHEFVARGWIVVSINYRLAPEHAWPKQIQDVTRALGWVKKNIHVHGGDPDRVIIAGASAGGHLAALAALSTDDPTWRPPEVELDDWSVRGCISLYGVLEMFGDPVVWRGHGGGLKALLEEAVVQRPVVGNEEVYAALSPLNRVTPSAPPFLVIQGRTDTLVDVNVARSFVDRFRSIATAPLYYVELPLTQHAFDLTASPRTSATTRAAVAFGEAWTARRDAPDELLARYEVPPTRLVVHVDHEDVDARDAAERLGRFVVISAANPYSQLRTAAQNEQSHAALEKELQRRGEDFWLTRAIDESGRWPDETGVALVGWSREQAQALADAWGQLAFYEVTAERVSVQTTQW